MGAKIANKKSKSLVVAMTAAYFLSRSAGGLSGPALVPPPSLQAAYLPALSGRGKESPIGEP